MTTYQPTPEQVHELGRAQGQAVHWAERAEAAYADAARHEAYARDRADSDYLRTEVTEARKEAAAAMTRCTEAQKLATMWAHVASILMPVPAPTELVSTEHYSVNAAFPDPSIEIRANRNL